MLTHSSTFEANLHRTHSDRGAFRSGMGSSDEAYAREQMFEEQERMEDLEETKEIVTDISLVERHFKFFNKQFQSRIGALPNDKLDQEPIESVIDRNSESLSGSAFTRAEGASKHGRALFKIKEPTIQINKLEEPYPTVCQNHG